MSDLTIQILKVSDNGRFLQYENGEPFFWLGDTGWLLFQKLSREEANIYLQNRCDKGFNVIQAMVIHELPEINFYGDTAFINNDLTRPNIYKWWILPMIQDFDYKKIARQLFDDIQKVHIKNVPNLRNVRQKYSKKLERATPKQILDFVRYFVDNYDYRWIAFEIIHCHKTAIQVIGVKELEDFGKQMNSWGTVDVFAGYLAGPAWGNGQIPDTLILDWANSHDYWWRRTALVCTVALNRRSLGGQGDIPRTLKICCALAADKNDMVVKALSWALRELISHDRNGKCCCIC